MASRRDELNAYSFARKRTTAAFLNPLPNGSIESAPRPLRTILPSVVVGALVMVGFGACGILKPVAPQGWDSVGGNVLVGDQSTTRYVVLKDTDENGKKQKLLHPVLNLASAKLLLDPKKFKVVKVKESELDGKLPHGPAVGIPFAPDRLPTSKDAGTPKTWAVCDRPGGSDTSAPEQAVFVLGGKDKQKVEGNGKLDLHQALYVENNNKYYLVDENGTAFQLDATMGGKFPYGPGAKDPAARSTSVADADNELRRILFHGAKPQQVTDAWMNTLIKSRIPIGLPYIPGAGQPSPAAGKLTGKAARIGSILQLKNNPQNYVVTADGIYQVSGFIANLLEEGPNAQATQGGSGALSPVTVSTGSFKPKQDSAGQEVAFMGKIDVPGVSEPVHLPWPSDMVDMANRADDRNTLVAGSTGQVSCSVYNGKSQHYADGAGKAYGFSGAVPEMSTWVGKDYPADIASGESAYVTPGSGLLYQSVTGNEKQGSIFLVTDTGLRYSIPVNNDTANAAASDKKKQDQSQAHLGYESVHPPTISKVWSDLLSAGPELSTTDAKKPQSTS